jgi:hypothetical protein
VRPAGRGSTVFPERLRWPDNHAGNDVAGTVNGRIERRQQALQVAAGAGLDQSLADLWSGCMIFSKMKPPSGSGCGPTALELTRANRLMPAACMPADVGDAVRVDADRGLAKGHAEGNARAPSLRLNAEWPGTRAATAAPRRGVPQNWHGGQ